MLRFLRSDPPKFTLFITALCVILYVLTSAIDVDGIIVSWMNFPAYMNEIDQYWRYFSHSLIHLSLIHITFNLSFWYLFGSAIEKTFGSFVLLLLYLIAAITSGFAQNYVSGPWFFGLSGVVFAVMGFVLTANYSAQRPLFDLPQGFITMILINIVIGFISPLVGIQIGNSAHISGLIVGLLMGYICGYVKKERK